jgi:hypothetical protein
MVDIRSIAGSSLHTQQGIEQEATSCSRTGRSRRTNAHGDNTAVGVTAASAHRQRSVATAAVPPPGAGLEAMLEAVCQLLHNPPGPHASPSAAKQWHHDVDQLIIVTINMSPHGGGQVNRFGRALEPSAAHLCSPAAELESHHSGQDGRVTIERQWERRHCLGRNLDGDFDAVVTAPVGQAAHTPTPPGRIWGWLYGACPVPLHGGLAAQVLTPLAGEVRWECQSRQVPADLLHLDPRRKRR